MENLYDLLGTSSDASQVELQVAIDARYNESRRIATQHPDPTRRLQAEQALQQLEQARSTLLDTARRAAYDASLGLSDVGGLADPAAAITARPMPPPVPPRPTPPSAPPQPALAWQCPACQTVNPPGTAHCQQCGRKLADPCPQCGHLTPLSARFCGSCGTDLAAARAERDRKLAAEEEARRQSQIANLEGQIAAEQSQIDLNNRLAGKWMSQSWGFSRNYGRESELLRTGGFSRGLWIAASLALPVVLCGLASMLNSTGGMYFVTLLLIAGVVGMIVFARRAKGRGADALNATHQAKIAAMREEIRRLRES